MKVIFLFSAINYALLHRLALSFLWRPLFSLEQVQREVHSTHCSAKPSASKPHKPSIN